MAQVCRGALVAVSICALLLCAAGVGVASSPAITVDIHISGHFHLDRLYRYAADLHDTGCTLIRQHAPPGKPHAYSYTLTINEGGRHFRRDTLYLTVDPYRRGQTVYSGNRSGRVQLFTEQHNKSVVITALPVAGVHFSVRLAPDLRSGTLQASGLLVSYGNQEGLKASMSASWTCPVLFIEHWG